MDTQLMTSIDLIPIMGEIELYHIGRFNKHLKQWESYDLARLYVAFWQKHPQRGVCEWLTIHFCEKEYETKRNTKV